MEEDSGSFAQFDPFCRRLDLGFGVNPVEVFSVTLPSISRTPSRVIQVDHSQIAERGDVTPGVGSPLLAPLRRPDPLARRGQALLGPKTERLGLIPVDAVDRQQKAESCVLRL